MLPGTLHNKLHGLRPYNFWEQNVQASTRTASEFLGYTDWQTGRKLSPTVRDLLVFTLLLFLRLAQTSLRAAFTLSSPATPCLWLMSARYHPLAQDRRSTHRSQALARARHTCWWQCLFWKGLRVTCVMDLWVRKGQRCWRSSPSQKAVEKGNSGAWQTHREPSGPILAQQEPGSNPVGLLPFTAWL